MSITADSHTVRLMQVPSDGGVLGLLADGGAAAVTSAMAAAVRLNSGWGEAAYSKRGGHHHGMAAAADSTNRGPGRFAHAGDAQQVLAQVIQEQISCRKEFDEARSEFEQANTIDDPFQRLNAIDKIRRGVLLRCGVRP